MQRKHQRHKNSRYTGQEGHSKKPTPSDIDKVGLAYLFTFPFSHFTFQLSVLTTLRVFEPRQHSLRT